MAPKWLKLPLPIGTEVPPYGKVSAVGCFGERYYWMVDKHGDVAMMPWFVVEPEVTTDSASESTK